MGKLTLGHSEIYDSGVKALSGGGVTINVEDLAHSYRHWFAAVEYYNDVAGGAGDVVTPTAGTETYTVTTPLKPNKQQTFVNNVINSADDEQVNWGSPTEKLRCVLASVAGNGVTHVRVRVLGMIS